MDANMKKMAHLANIIADRCETIAELSALVSMHSKSIEEIEDCREEQSKRFSKQQAILINIREELSRGKARNALSAIRKIVLQQWEGEDVPF